MAAVVEFCWFISHVNTCAYMPLTLSPTKKRLTGVLKTETCEGAIKFVFVTFNESNEWQAVTGDWAVKWGSGL